MATSRTESSLLTNFLLPPAPLPALISLKTFTALFPHTQRSSPAIRALYRNLQTLRLQTIDQVNQNIINETKRGTRQRRILSQARQGEKYDELGDVEVELEESAFGPFSNLPVSKPHTLRSIVTELSLAVKDLENECEILEEEEMKTLEELQAVIGGLSDLKYGKLENPHLRIKVAERCLRLENFCDENT
ncbi:putative cnl2 nkp2 family protein [Erysiphe neolycopersici]|uniref:Putative cnl2 nkp2 family protein n=1 Tax=Erysiphe neolycopersici TaxID=212602 RepID=A0A420HZF6_9PEZI|nr:putative cnl2 nkp2 family protein [Erysiphe neolycopersici]